jgi:hypothetical protein
MIFLAHGSVLQIIVAVAVTLFFLIGTARIMPYDEFTSSRFKLLTETALLFTLVFPVLLKVNLVKENIDEFQMGILMLVSDTVLPGGGLALAMLYSFYIHCRGNRGARRRRYRKTRNRDQRNQSPLCKPDA